MVNKNLKLGLMVVLLFSLCFTGIVSLKAHAEESTNNIDTAVLKELATYLVSNNATGDNIENLVAKWSIITNLESKIVRPEGNLEPVIVVVKEIINHPLPYNRQLIIWWDKGKVCLQEISPNISNDGFPLPGADKLILQEQKGKKEIGIVYDYAYGSAGTVRPGFELYRLEDNHWKQIWTSPRVSAWRDTDGNVSFPKNNLDEIVITGTGWMSGYAEDQIFEESHASSHRILSNTWTRKGDEYVLKKWDEVKQTPYAALTSFMVALKNRDMDVANKYCISNHLAETMKQHGVWGVQKMKEMRVNTDSKWTDSDVIGPVVFTATESTSGLYYSRTKGGNKIIFTLEKKDGQWVVSDISL